MNTHAAKQHASKQPGFLPPRHLYGALVRKMNQEKPRIRISSLLAHEVRNPLSNINLAVELLSDSIHEKDREQLVDIIKRASLRINGLITELLTSALPAEVQYGNQSINQLLDKVVSMAEDRIRLKNISVTREYTAIDSRIWMDKQQMEIALTNIIINAIDAMPRDTGKLKLVTQSVNGLSVVTIEDNGIGIAKENLANIFKPFFTRKSGGMGIGLSTTLEILRANHIRADVRSEPGHGTRFLLSFERAGM